MNGARQRNTAAGRAIKTVSDQLRALPDNGAGYGLLRYLNPRTGPELAGLPAPQISFNYLGRFAGGGSGEGAEGGASPAGSDPGMPLAHALAMNALAQDNPEGPSLVATWSWPPELFTEAEVRGLAEAWFRALRALVSHAGHPDAGTGQAPAPGRSLMVDLSQDEIDELEDELGLED